MQSTRFLKVTFFAALVLLSETVLFHLLMFIHEFFSATAVISYAVLGIGLGAFAASRIKARESVLFYWCAIGTTVALYAVSFILLRYPGPLLIAAGIALCVFFPLIFIAVLFREHPGGKIYLFDMAGAGLGVVATVILYEFMGSEEIILLLVALVPLIGAIDLVRATDVSRLFKGVGAVLAIVFVIGGAVLLTLQITTDSLNIYRLFDRESSYEVPKILKHKKPDALVKSYDSLIERIDVIGVGSKNAKTGRYKKYNVCYNGFANDHFTPKRHREYDYFIEKGIEWPSGDQRVFYGFTEEPSIYIIGAAARGITETVKKITPPENVVPVEIDPSIVELMTKDFYKESGRSYHGLKPVVGNALSLLKSMDREFDIITLINTHSARNIGERAGPDFLQSAENYNLYLDHMTDKGFALFEERVFNRSGELGFYRMLNTMWHVLQERGAEDPSKHFFIWEWDASRSYPRIDRRYNEEKEQFRHASTLYYGMIVTKNPIRGEMLDSLMHWYRDGVSICRVSYLKDVMEWGELPEIFSMIETGDFSKLEEEDFDTRLVTNDLPFPSLSTTSIPEIDELLKSATIVSLVLLLIFVVGVLFKNDKKKGLFLSGFNIAIGLGYFFIEIMLLQVYQNIFVSPSWSLVLVLGGLLISSGIGGLYASRFKPWQVTALLIPIAIVAIFAPGWLVASPLPLIISKVISVVLICVTGFLLGLFFPLGLVLADKWGLKSKVPHLFAINSVAGSYAVILALYSGARIGYQATVIIATICYCIAGLMVVAAQKRS